MIARHINGSVCNASHTQGVSGVPTQHNPPIILATWAVGQLIWQQLKNHLIKPDCAHDGSFAGRKYSVASPDGQASGHCQILLQQMRTRTRAPGARAHSLCSGHRHGERRRVGAASIGGQSGPEGRHGTQQRINRGHDARIGIAGFFRHRLHGGRGGDIYRAAIDRRPDRRSRAIGGIVNGGAGCRTTQRQTEAVVIRAGNGAEGRVSYCWKPE